MADVERLASHNICYLTTTGRVTGRPHRVEIWFALKGYTLYILHGGGIGDWVKNVLRHPMVTVTIGGSEFAGNARLLVKGEEEDALARQLLAEKYQRTEDDLDEWLATATALAVDLVT
ncbi:MAG TPA: nitroreductase family deazaflavin-dependent oxidoreductase [Ktedonobacteraceae bacterium]|nr:nitroreductase family deazaflavin-dependent oxidoreductase [Ktedonobacteraceae bacterium]